MEIGWSAGIRAAAVRRGARWSALALLAIAPAPAAALSTTVVATSIAGPNAAMTSGSSAAVCGGLVSGGGVRMDQAVLANGVHVVGSFPTPDGISASLHGDRDPTAWIGAGGIGGQATSGVTTWGYALCLAAPGLRTQVVSASTPGPTATFSGVLATATCPPGTRLLSGGARTTPGTVGSLKPNGSFPSDAAGAPVVSGANPTSWTAAGLNGGQPPAGNTTHAWALCAGGAPLPAVVVRNARVAGPGPASTGAQVTTACPPGGVLLGGGGYISDGFALPGSQGDHLTGSFPSDAAGTPIAAGPAAAWTASSHTGGTDSGPLTVTDAWALCGMPAAAAGGPGSPPLPPPTVAQPGAIAGGITIAQIRESIRRQITPRGSAARIAVLLRRGGARLRFRSLERGRLAIEWRRPSGRGRSTVVARGGRTFARSGERLVEVRLTAAGRRALRGARRVALTARGTFTRGGQRPIVGTKAFVVTRDGAARAG